VIGQPDPSIEHLPGGAFSVQVASVAPASVDTPSPSAVPEPTSWLMLIAGMGLLGAVSLRNRRD
jgi:PEP-CTERM motif-containing protein